MVSGLCYALLLQSYQTFLIGSNIGEFIKCVTLSLEVPQHI